MTDVAPAAKLRIAALGVTGGTGQHLLRLALARGHHVTALARRPEAVDAVDENLVVHRADVYDPSTMVEAFRDVDVVVSVLGVSGLLESRKGTTVYSQGTAAIRAAMADAGVKRLIVVSSGGVEPQPNDNWFYTNVLKRFFLEPIYRDMRTMEGELRESGLDFTIVRPSFLVGDKQSTGYRTIANRPFDDDKTLSRWSLAHFLVSEAETAAHAGSVVYVSN